MNDIVNDGEMVVIHLADQTIEHQLDGLIFSRTTREVHGVSIESYVRIDDVKPCREMIIEGIVTGEWPDTAWFGCVRHGNPRTGKCGYYPLPLLFGALADRLQAATEQGKRPPAERWVRHVRGKVETNLGLIGD